MTSSPGADPADLATAGDTIAEPVQDYLLVQLDAYADGDRALREGVDRIYPTRVAIRRMRSTLRTFADLFEPAARRQLDRELRWWAGLLGEVRDRTVQIAGIGAVADRLGDTETVADARAFVVAALRRQHDVALQAIESELVGERQPHVTSLAQRWRAAPFDFHAAAEPRTAVAGYVERARERVEAALANARRPDAADIDVHGARKAGKRYRYSLELAAPVMGDEATTAAIVRARALQDELGAYQDSVVGLALLDDIARTELMSPTVRHGIEQLRRGLEETGDAARARALAFAL